MAKSKVSGKGGKADKNLAKPQKGATGKMGESQYPTLKVDLMLGEDALTAHQMMALLGWEEIPEGDTKTPPLLVDVNKRKIHCRKNAKNRPFDKGWSESLMWDILNKNWADSRNSPEGTEGVGTVDCQGYTINGETMVIGRSGEVLSGQHRGIALILAYQTWLEDQKLDPEVRRWGKIWAEEPTIECIIVYGVDESPRTIRTLDNTKKRTFADVLFTDPKFFGTDEGFDDPSARRAVMRAVETCVRTLWQRTDAKDSPFHPSATHSELLEFLDRHKRIVDCVRYIHELREEESRVKEERKKNKEDSIKNSVTDNIPDGYAAALLYLMGASATSPEEYYGTHNAPRKEAQEDGTPNLNWANWDKAREYWRLLYVEHPRTRGVRLGIATLQGTPGQFANRDADLIMGAVVEGWNTFILEDEVSDACPPELVSNKGKLVMVGNVEMNSVFPVVEGGLDKGKKKKEKKDKEESLSTKDAIVEDHTLEEDEADDSEEYDNEDPDDTRDEEDEYDSDEIPSEEEVEDAKHREYMERNHGEEEEPSLHDSVKEELSRREESKKPNKKK